MWCFISESIRDGDYLAYLTYLRVVGVWTGKVGKVTDSNPGPWVAVQACVMPTNGPSTAQHIRFYRASRALGH